MCSSCAYTWGPGQRRMPGSYERVHVKMYENRTLEVGIEADVTNMMIQRVAKSGLAQITSKDQAQLELRGVIHTVDFLGKTAITTPEGAPLFTEYQTRMSVIVRVVEVATGKELWQGQFLGEKNYRAPQLTRQTLRTSNPLYNQSAKRRVIREMAEDIAAEAFVSMTENF